MPTLDLSRMALAQGLSGQQPAAPQAMPTPPWGSGPPAAPPWAQVGAPAAPWGSGPVSTPWGQTLGRPPVPMPSLTGQGQPAFMPQRFAPLAQKLWQQQQAANVRQDMLPANDAIARLMALGGR